MHNLSKETSFRINIRKNYKFFYVICSIGLLTYLSIYVSFDTVGTHNQVTLNYYFDFQKEKPLFSSPNIYGKKSIFHTEYQDNYFNIFLLGRSGSLENKFNILKKDGYITYPNNASFFLWYPRLGSHIKIYNDSGEILLEDK